MLEDLTEAASQAVELARKAGATDAFATSSRNRGVELEYRNGKLEKSQESTSRSLSLKLYVDGRYAVHATTDLRPRELKTFVVEAVAMTRALEPDEFRRITDPALFRSLPELDLELSDPKIEEQGNPARIARCAAMAEIAGANDRVVSASAWSSDGHALGAVVSSNGFSSTWDQTYFWLGAEVTLQDEGDKRPQDGMWAGARYLADAPSPDEIGHVALARALARLGTKKGPTKQATMVVHPMAAGRLIRFLLRPAMARMLQQGKSFLAALRDKQPFSKALTLTDDPLLRRGIASRRFDSEGIAAKPTTFIEEGRIRNFYIDTYYGAKLKMAPTTGEPSNVIVATGKRSCDALLQEAKTGICVTNWLGGNSDGTTGDFSLGCRGRMIEEGKLGLPVGEMNVTGNLATLFSNLVEVGDDPWPYTSVKAPTLVFEKVQFSGA